MERKFKAWLILNWQTGAMRIIKGKTRTIGPQEIDIQLAINVTIPDRVPFLLEAEVEIPVGKVEQILAMEVDREVCVPS